MAAHNHLQLQSQRIPLLASRDPHVVQTYIKRKSQNNAVTLTHIMHAKTSRLIGISGSFKSNSKVRQGARHINPATWVVGARESHVRGQCVLEAEFKASRNRLVKSMKILKMKLKFNVNSPFTLSMFSRHHFLLFYVTLGNSWSNTPVF